MSTYIWRFHQWWNDWEACEISLWKFIENKSNESALAFFHCGKVFLMEIDHWKPNDFNMESNAQISRRQLNNRHMQCIDDVIELQHLVRKRLLEIFKRMSMHVVDTWIDVACDAKEMWTRQWHLTPSDWTLCSIDYVLSHAKLSAKQNSVEIIVWKWNPIKRAWHFQSSHVWCVCVSVNEQRESIGRR